MRIEDNLASAAAASTMEKKRLEYLYTFFDNISQPLQSRFLATEEEQSLEKRLLISNIKVFCIKFVSSLTFSNATIVDNCSWHHYWHSLMTSLLVHLASSSNIKVCCIKFIHDSIAFLCWHNVHQLMTSLTILNEIYDSHIEAQLTSWVSATWLTMKDYAFNCYWHHRHQ